MSDPLEAQFATLSIHADDRLNIVPDVAPPIHLATTFRYNDNPDELIPEAEQTAHPDDRPIIYSRLASPNSNRFEAILSSLLKGRAIAYASGLAAFNAAVTLLNPRRVAIGQGYHGCHAALGIFSRLNGLKKLDLDCPAEDLDRGDLIVVETPVNPHGTALNIAHYAEKAHSRGAYLMVDSTFAPPGLQDPFEFGADLIMHSGSKYFGGHSDMLCGVLVTRNDEWYRQLWTDRIYLGSTLGSLELWLGVRSLRTLQLRVQRASENAEKLVAFLQGALDLKDEPAPDSDEAAVRACVAKISHASLQKEDWVRKQMPRGFGPVFSIQLHDADKARRLPSRLKFFHHATSLGGVESLIEWRAMSDPRVDRRLLRISVGIEDVEDLRKDMVTAFRELK
ncbi:hypothetical protein VTN49DRAFT_6275 [Thermomyces lanuginosus]|uniref:uncharacterized protein n=1 Tax=Thermomyces lanuginosus TaxID=5541 RepID=UPI003742D49F